MKTCIVLAMLCLQIVKNDPSPVSYYLFFYLFNLDSFSCDVQPKILELAELTI